MEKITSIDQLGDYQIRYIVMCYASFHEPEVVERYFAETYGKEIDRDILMTMNPDISSLCVLDDKYIAHFKDVRNQLIQDFPLIPIANRHYRLEILQGIYSEYARQGKAEKCTEILELIQHETQPLYEELHRHFVENEDKIRVGEA